VTLLAQGRSTVPRVRRDGHHEAVRREAGRRCTAGRLQTPIDIIRTPTDASQLWLPIHGPELAAPAIIDVG